MHIIKKIVFFILFLNIFNCCHANIDNPFKVENIHVYARTGNLVDSKSAALDKGSKDALLKLMLNLSANSNKRDEKLYKISSCINNLTSSPTLVKNYVIKSERMTSKSYSGFVDVVFNQEEIKSIMSTCGLKYASVSSGETLLVPLLFDKNFYKLIDSETNSFFYNAVDKMNDSFGLMNFKKVFNRSIFDVSAVDPESFINGSYNTISQVLKHYDCTSALVIMLKLNNKNVMTAEMRIIRKNDEYHDSFKYHMKHDESQEMFVSRVLHELLREADLVWKRCVKEKNQTVFNSNVIFEMSTPEDWKKIRTVLNKLDIVKQYKFRTISNNDIEVELKYVNSPEILSQKLLSNGIAVFKRNDKTTMKLINKT